MGVQGGTGKPHEACGQETFQNGNDRALQISWRCRWPGVGGSNGLPSFAGWTSHLDDHRFWYSWLICLVDSWQPVLPLWWCGLDLAVVQAHQHPYLPRCGLLQESGAALSGCHFGRSRGEQANAGTLLSMQQSLALRHPMCWAVRGSLNIVLLVCCNAASAHPGSPSGSASASTPSASGCCCPSGCCTSRRQ